MKHFSAFKRSLPRIVALGLAIACCGRLWAAEPESTNSVAARPSRDRLADLFGDPVVAKGKGFEIKRSELDAEALHTKEALAVSQRPIPTDLDRQVLDGLITLKLLLGKATPADRAKAKEQFEKQFASFKTDRKLTDEEFEEKLSRTLKLEGKTKTEWQQQQIDQLTIPIVIQREFNTTPTDEQAKKYYENNVSRFEEPEMLKLSHILISTHDPSDPNPNLAQKRELPPDQKKAKRALAEDLVKRARAGEDFSKLAREYSDDVDVKQNSGNIQLARDGFAPEEFKVAAFAMNTTNQISDVVTSVLGYHVIKYLGRIPARKEPFAGLDTKTIVTKPDGTKYTIRDALNDEMVRKELPNLVKKLKHESDVQVLDPKLRVEEPAAAEGSK
jgi:parvulin-like peptidyl-prolyl isomerase